MDKRRRSQNFINQEKEMLLSIIAKYQSIIDCKSTSSSYNNKKQKAWELVTKEFNDACINGPRHEETLKNLYHNMKRRRQHIRTEQHFEVIMDEKNVVTINQILMKDLKNEWTDKQDKIINTDSDSLTPMVVDADPLICSDLDSLTQPDEKPCDDAAMFFGKVFEEIPEACNSSLNRNLLPESKDCQEVSSVPESKPLIKRKMKYVPKRKKTWRNLSFSRLKLSANALKQIYFKKKIEIAHYQKQNEIQKLRFEKEKHELEIQILKKQLALSEKDLTQ